MNPNENELDVDLKIRKDIYETLAKTKEKVESIEKSTARISQLIADPEKIESRSRRPFPTSFFAVSALYLFVLHVLSGILFYSYYSYTSHKVEDLEKHITELDQTYKDRLSNLEILIDNHVRPVPWIVKQQP